MKAKVKEIVKKMDSSNCSYPHHLITMPGRPHTVLGEGVLQKVKKWLSPPDPSTNYNIGLRDLYEESATWFLDSLIFQEWHSTGSLLWIDGKRAFVEVENCHFTYP